MPKFKSVLVRKEKKNADGSIQESCITAWVPENDAAKAHNLSDKAVELGKYERATPTEKEDMKAALKVKAQKAAGMMERPM